MSLQARVYHLLNALVLLSLLLSPLQSLAQPSFASTQAPPRGVGQVGNLSNNILETGLFRTRVTVRTPADWARLEKLGVVVLEKRTADAQENADQGTPPSASSRESAVILADADQLEALARLRFERESTDELGLLVARHATEKPWLAQSLRTALSEATTLSPGPSPSQGEGRQKAGMRVSLTTEQQAGVIPLSSMGDDADGLTNTQEQWWYAAL